MGTTYKQLIFSNHALERMGDRSISKDSVWQTVSQPDRSHPEEKPETARFIRTINDRTYHVVGRYLATERKTLIISVWVRGEDDAMPVAWWLITAPFRAIFAVIRWLFSKQK